MSAAHIPGDCAHGGVLDVVNHMALSGAISDKGVSSEAMSAIRVAMAKHIDHALATTREQHLDQLLAAYALESDGKFAPEVLQRYLDANPQHAPALRRYAQVQLTSVMATDEEIAAQPDEEPSPELFARVKAEIEKLRGSDRPVIHELGKALTELIAPISTPLDRALINFGNACFDCGHWDEDRSEIAYAELLTASRTAQAAVRAAVDEMVKDAGVIYGPGTEGEFTLQEALDLAAKSAKMYEGMPSISRTLIAEIERLRAAMGFLQASEVKWLSESPEALRIAANYRDFQQGQADACEAGTTGDEARRLMLIAEAQRLEDLV